MAYVAVKGGEQAIDAAHAWLAEERRGDPHVPALSMAQIQQQLGRAVDRVMAEGSLYDRELAALAIRQAQGDLIEAAFLLRAWRTTLPRFGYSDPLQTEVMRLRRRISAIFKDIPGGQRLGPTTDYSHRLLDFSLLDDAPQPTLAPTMTPLAAQAPRVIDLLGAEALIEADGLASPPSGDITLTPTDFPAPRDQRLQALARGDEGFLLALGYSTQRGYGNNHPFVGELRTGEVAVSFTPPELGFSIEIGEMTLTECQMVNQFAGSKHIPPQFTRGYGLCFGHADRRAIATALLDRALRSTELGEDASAPAQDAEFVLAHCDNIEATGFVEHLKLPHHVDFQSELELVRTLRSAGTDSVTPPSENAAGHTS